MFLGNKPKATTKVILQEPQKITEIEDDEFGFWFELQKIHVAKAAHATVNTSAVPFDVSRVLGTNFQ